MANVFDDFLFEIGAEVAVKGTRGTNTKLSISETLSEAIERQITMAKIDASSYPIEDGRCSLPVLGGRGRPQKWYKFDKGKLEFTTYFGNSKLGNPFFAPSWVKLIEVLEKIQVAAEAKKFDSLVEQLAADKKAKGAATRAQSTSKDSIITKIKIAENKKEYAEAKGDIEEAIKQEKVIEKLNDQLAKAS